MVSKVLLVYLTCSSRKLPKQQRKHLHASHGKSETEKTYVKSLRGSLKDTLADSEDTELEEFTGKKRWWGHANHIPGRIQCEFDKTWAGLERKPGKSTQWGRQWLSRGLNRGEKEENIPKELEWEQEDRPLLQGSLNEGFPIFRPIKN